LFDYNINNGQWAEFSPGATGRLQLKSVSDWPNHRLWFNKWMGYLKREITQEDLWEEYSKKINNHIELDNSTLSKYTAEEVLALSGHLRLLQQNLIDLKCLSEERQKVVDDKILYLEQGLIKHTKYDWFNLAVGVVFPMLWDIAKETPQVKEKVKELSVSFSQAIEIVTQGVGLLR
jgi:uncharacterized protein Smg (DUF494 family)